VYVTSDDPFAELDRLELKCASDSLDMATVAPKNSPLMATIGGAA
jgi:hypothetical protein